MLLEKSIQSAPGMCSQGKVHISFSQNKKPRQTSAGLEDSVLKAEFAAGQFGVK
jgi:hypothetical protein